VRHGSTRRIRLLAATALAALVVPLAAGCGADSGDSGGGKAAPHAPVTRKTTVRPNGSAPPGKAYTIEQLAAKLGCKPQFQGKAADFRQASCPVGGDPVLLMQFDKASGQHDWLDYAMSYGGVYLVGDRWVLSGKSQQYMEGLQAKFGGQIEQEDAG
jgi:hypothetical protein